MRTPLTRPLTRPRGIARKILTRTGLTVHVPQQLTASKAPTLTQGLTYKVSPGQMGEPFQRAETGGFGQGIHGVRGASTSEIPDPPPRLAPPAVRHHTDLAHFARKRENLKTSRQSGQARYSQRYTATDSGRRGRRWGLGTTSAHGATTSATPAPASFRPAASPSTVPRIRRRVQHIHRPTGSPGRPTRCDRADGTRGWSRVQPPRLSGPFNNGRVHQWNSTKRASRS